MYQRRTTWLLSLGFGRHVVGPGSRIARGAQTRRLDVHGAPVPRGEIGEMWCEAVTLLQGLHVLRDENHFRTLRGSPPVLTIGTMLRSSAPRDLIDEGIPVTGTQHTKISPALRAKGKFRSMDNRTSV